MNLEYFICFFWISINLRDTKKAFTVTLCMSLSSSKHKQTYLLLIHVALYEFMISDNRWEFKLNIQPWTFFDQNRVVYFVLSPKLYLFRCKFVLSCKNTFHSSQEWKLIIVLSLYMKLFLFFAKTCSSLMKFDM